MKAILVIDVDDISRYHADIYKEDDKGNGELVKPYCSLKPLPDRMGNIDSDLPFIKGFRNGFNTCIEIMEIYGENYVVQKEKE